MLFLIISIWRCSQGLLRGPSNIDLSKRQDEILVRVAGLGAMQIRRHVFFSQDVHFTSIVLGSIEDENESTSDPSSKLNGYTSKFEMIHSDYHGLCNPVYRVCSDDSDSSL